jgi:hypothetical protein
MKVFIVAREEQNVPQVLMLHERTEAVVSPWWQHEVKRS